MYPEWLVGCVEVLRPSKQLKSYRASQLPIKTFPEQAYLFTFDILSGKPVLSEHAPEVTDNYRGVITADITIFKSCGDEALENEDRIDDMKKKKKKKNTRPAPAASTAGHCPTILPK